MRQSIDDGTIQSGMLFEDGVMSRNRIRATGKSGTILIARSICSRRESSLAEFMQVAPSMCRLIDAQPAL